MALQASEGTKPNVPAATLAKINQRVHLTGVKDDPRRAEDMVEHVLGAIVAARDPCFERILGGTGREGNDPIRVHSCWRQGLGARLCSTDAASTC